MPKRNAGTLGTFDSVNLLVGGMIGSAIFSLSGMTIWRAGPASIVSWAVAGIILFLYGLQTAELAAIYPDSGGVFVFPALSLGKTERQGRLWGWISAWAYLFGCVAGAAFSAIYVGTYLGVAFPACADLQVPIAIGAVVFCGALNVVNFSVTGRVNTFLTVVLVATLLVFAVMLFASGQWNEEAFVPFFTQGAAGKSGFLDAIPIAMVAYGAIVAGAFMVGEIRNPNKTIPKAMAIAMGVVVVLYLLVIVATLGFVPAHYLEANPGMRYIPLFAASSLLSSVAWLPKLLSISAVLALITTIIVTTALAARTLQACADSGLLVRKLGENNKRTGVPVYATLVIVLVTGILASIPRLADLLINMGALCNVIVIAIVCLSVIAARKKHPDPTGQRFHAPGGKGLPIGTLVVLVACYIPGIIGGGWLLWAYTIGYYVVGMVLYAFGMRHHGDGEHIDEA